MEEKFVPSNTQEELAKAIASFDESFASRSFSGRHPELGKMVNCQVCSLRHRSSQVCHQRHVVNLTPPEGLTDLTRFQVLGRKQFEGKRVNPHYSTKRQQLLQRTIELYPLHDGMYASTEQFTVEQVTMHAARREARESLEKERSDKRSALQSAQHRSRRINRGLLEGNSRIHR